MSSGKSTYLANKFLDAVFGNQAFPSNATLYIALFTVNPTAGGGGTEVTGGSYVRKAVTNNLTEWPAASAQTKSNANVQTFVTATADWGTVTGAAVFDAPSGGNMLDFGSLTQSKVISNGDTAAFAATALVANET